MGRWNININRLTRRIEKLRHVIWSCLARGNCAHLRLIQIFLGKSDAGEKGRDFRQLFFLPSE